MRGSSANTYTHDELRTIINRSYDTNRNLGCNHAEAVTNVAHEFGIEDEDKILPFINSDRPWENLRAIVGTSEPGDRTDDIVPDTFPEDWV